jgi:hypothetical protein
MKEGINWQVILAAIPSLLVLFRLNAVRKHFPWLFKPNSEVKEYVNNQRIIMENQRLMMEHMGVSGWDAHYEQVSKSQGVTDGQKSNLKPTWVALARARIIGGYILQMVRSNHSKTKGENIRMKKWIRPDKLTIIFGSLATAANEFLGTGIESGNIAAFFVILFTYLKSNEIINITRYSHGLPVEFRVNSSKLWFTLIGLGLTFYKTYSGEVLSQESIYSIAAMISGYNVYEGNKDVQEAQKEAAGGNHYR